MVLEGVCHVGSPGRRFPLDSNPLVAFPFGRREGSVKPLVFCIAESEVRRQLRCSCICGFSLQHVGLPPF